MPLVATDAIVLHVFDYLETSRIFKLATRDLGVQSVLARGARRSSGRFGSALDLFAEGVAQLDVRPGRDMQTLTGFDVVRSRPELASDMARFTAAAAVSECVQRVVTEDHAPAAYEITQRVFTALTSADGPAVVSTTLRGLWQLVAELGFAPNLVDCAVCHTEVALHGSASFSHAAGGVICASCSSHAAGARRLPETARFAIQSWITGDDDARTLEEAEGRAHQRLLREFLGHHVTDTRTMKAWVAWEQGRWG